MPSFGVTLMTVKTEWVAAACVLPYTRDTTEARRVMLDGDATVYASKGGVRGAEGSLMD